MPRNIIDPDESDEEVNEIVRRRPSRASRASSQPTSQALQRRAPRVVATIEEEDDEEENEPPIRRPAARLPTMAVSRPRVLATIEGRNQSRAAVREAPERQRSKRRPADGENLDESALVVAGKNESIADAVLAVLALSSKGPIKEADLKPLLLNGRYRDWQDGLTEMNKHLSTAFGFTVTYDGVAKLFFLRNDMLEVKSELFEMFHNGTLNHIRIDDGTLSRKVNMADAEEFNEDDKKGLLFTVLASIMMSNNIELGHKNWSVEEEIMKHLCIENMGISTAIFEKLLSGKTAEFIKEGWVRKSEEVIGDQNSIIHYFWGSRAIATVSTLKIFEKFCIVYQTPKAEWGNYETLLKKLDQKNDLYHPR